MSFNIEAHHFLCKNKHTKIAPIDQIMKKKNFALTQKPLMQKASETIKKIRSTEYIHLEAHHFTLQISEAVGLHQMQEEAGAPHSPYKH